MIAALEGVSTIPTGELVLAARGLVSEIEQGGRP
jgi:hypothetical protein